MELDGTFASVIDYEAAYLQVAMVGLEPNRHLENTLSAYRTRRPCA